MNGLFGSTVLDVATGLVFVYLLLAIICTSLNEWIAQILHLRAKNLARGIKQLLDGQPKTTDKSSDLNWFLDQFYKHPLVKGMTTDGAAVRKDNHPSYIPARTFATVVMDIATGEKQAPINLADLQSGINSLPDGDVKKSLSALLQKGHEDVDEAQKTIESWFDDTMDRVSGWYKRKVQLVTLVVAILLTVGANADTFRIARMLWHNPELRAQGVKLAEQRVQEGNPQPMDQSSSAARVTYPDKNNPLQPKISVEERQFLGDLVGWQKGVIPRNANLQFWLTLLLGWIMTALAVSLGAPFWFDILNKVVNIRSAGKSPDEKAKTPEKKKLPPADKAA